MSTELRIKFLGEYPDARDAVTALNRILKVATAASALQHHDGTRRWQFAHLSLGSVEAGITVAPDISDDEEATFREIIRGLEQAEEREGAPQGWNEDLTRTAWEMLSSATSEGVELQLLRAGEQLRTARITRTAHRHLGAALESEPLESVGALIGQLDSANLHEGRRARLWPEDGGPGVEIRFEARLDDQVRRCLGRRVQARGRLIRSAFGTIKYMRLRHLEQLPTFEESPPLSALVGLDPDFTGGIPADEYLREIRG